MIERQVRSGDSVAAFCACKANAVEPWAYLRDLFTRLPALSSALLDELLPHTWLAAHPQHRWLIDDLRREERSRKRR